MLVILDYGIGNLSSIKNMLKKAGFDARVASDAASVEPASKIILPGIGAFDHCMQRFNASGLRPIIETKVFESKIPILGICVGLQMLMDSSEEGTEAGLGWVSGKTVKFQKDRLENLKIPHMGWAEVDLSKESPLTKDIGERPRFYFVHSYYVEPDSKSAELLMAQYGHPFVAGISEDNIFGVQFHPEKSHRFGMKILENFAKL
jgi:glutamine amidotransferase